MRYAGRVISYNGEIYNYKEIRKDLEILGHGFNSDSDTEILLMSIEEWGLEKALRKFRGMFAFAMWEPEWQRVTLVRDRFGIKPLYFAMDATQLAFASELKALEEWPLIDRSIDNSALSIYMHRGYIPAPFTIYENVRKLEAGTYFQWQRGKEPIIKKWWNSHDLLDQPIRDQETESQLLEQLVTNLEESMRFHLVSDVPVGLFLSGGVDSSLMTAILRRELEMEVQTFTIGFEDPEIDESSIARKVSQYLGTSHVERIMTKENYRRIFDEYATGLDEPFGDSSRMATYFLSELASKEVKVCLSGDGGDELFGGYDKYRAALWFYQNKSILPTRVRQWIAEVAKFGGDMILGPNAMKKSYKLSRAMESSDIWEFFENVSGHHGYELLDAHDRPDIPRLVKPAPNRILSALGLLDIENYLEGDILVKADRAGMAHGLEIRMPYLDHELASWAFTLPDLVKLKGKENKYILRKLLRQYLPAELVDRPKRGFRLPIGQWMREWSADDLRMMVKDKRFYERFDLDMERCRQELAAFIEGKKGSNEDRAWFLLVLYRWSLNNKI
jgi:asparagine synthase (glutamine-hydrolysing)